MSQFYPLKSILEQILGQDTYKKLKETGTLNDWKKVVKKLLNTIEFSINETVEITDEDFFRQINDIIKHGINSVDMSKEASDLFSHLSATLIKIVFLQIGYIPSTYVKNRPLRKGRWNLSYIRSVQYVQNQEQKQFEIEMKKQQSFKN